MAREIFKSNVLILLIFLAMLFSNVSALAGTSHGVNGYVHDCNTGYNVTGAYVVFQLCNSTGNPKPSNSLNATVGSDGWYYVDAGNFDVPWIENDTVLINISKENYTAVTRVTLTKAGNDQAFTVCLGPPANWSCACGNGVCEWWVPLCENEEFNVTIAAAIVTTKRCPEDCSDCVCGNGICQPECGENVPNSTSYCPTDCPPAYCGDGIINSPTEQCDGADWGNVTGCESFGFSGGILSCKDCAFDTSQCIGASGYCGDGVINPGEQCDGDNFGMLTCELLGFGPGDLACKECKIDTSNCGAFLLVPFGRREAIKPTCCLFGYCRIWLGLCWYVWIAIAIAIAVAIIYLLTRWNLSKIVRALDSLTKLKTIALAEKARLYEKWH